MRNAIGYIVTVVAALCWGSSGVSAEYLMIRHGMDTMAVSFYRMFIGGILTLAYVLARSRGISAQHRDFVSSARNWRALIVYAIFGLVACQLSYLLVIRASNAGTGTVLEYLGLILIVVWVCLHSRRWPRPSEVVAMILALTGTLLLSTHGRLDTLALTPHALGWGAVAAITLAVYTLLPRRLIAAYGADLIVGYGLIIGGLTVAITGRVWRYSTPWSPPVIAALAVAIVLGTAVAFTCYLWGVDRIGPVKASLIGCLEPIAAAVFSSFVMGTTYTGIDIAGMGLIVAAVVSICVVDLLRARRATQGAALP